MPVLKNIRFHKYRDTKQIYICAFHKLDEKDNYETLVKSLSEIVDIKGCFLPIFENTFRNYTYITICLPPENQNDTYKKKNDRYDITYGIRILSSFDTSFVNCDLIDIQKV